MSAPEVTSGRSSPAPETCPECDATASVTSDLHKYQVACTCKPGSVQYACADDPGPPPPAKTDTPPALPPRPPTSVLATNRRNNATVGCNGQEQQCRRRKYAWWCVGCGALAAALGGLLAAQHILVRAYTASPHHLETVPAAVPAAMLVLTGVCIMSLARRRNRYSYMIKVVGACCLMCALTCVLVTITTTVIHMNKLQTLKFCEYTKLTRSCTCFSMPPDTQHGSADDEGVRCVFEGVSECGVVHGALYWCLRGVFALSVSAVLVCIFSCMLAYQLLSHERKKMYWEQLELRCRSLYRPPAGQAAPPAGRTPQSTCPCCAAPPPWAGRLWAPGARRAGNLYSPTPARGKTPWSWFPWPRSSQHSRCRMGGVPQSGDSAYGFCPDPPSNPQPPYEDRPYPTNYPQQYQQQNFQQQTFPANFPTQQFQGNFPTQPGFQGNFGQQSNFQGQGYQEFGEASGSFDAQTGVWGPPPPYSPQGRTGSRHHLHHQDPATATLLHHHHIDVHRNSTIHDHTVHDHPPIHDHTNIQPHTCTRNSYLIHQNDRVHPENMRQDLARINPDLARHNPDIARHNPDIARHNPDIARLNPEIARLNPELARMTQDLARQQEIARMNPELARINPDLVRMNPDLARLNSEIGQMYPSEEMEMQEGRFNTLRGHLVPYRCQRLGMSASNLHRDCRVESEVGIECMHQKSASKVSDQSSDSCQKQGKENLGFQNDKHSPIRSSMQDCRGNNQNAESEVYFADVSSCCNVSVKAECCMNPNVSALVGTIENHPESTSESDTGSFTLTRQQRPQPQVGSKRRNRQTEKQDKRVNNSVRLTEHQIEQLNMRMNGIELNRMNDSRDRLERVNDSRDRLSDSRNELDRMNDSRISDRMNETRMSERMSERACERMNESRLERMNDSRISERFNDSRLDRLNESLRMNDSRVSERLNDSRISERMNDSRVSERINETRISDRMNESRHSDRMNEPRIRMNETCSHERPNDSRLERMSDLNSSIRIEGSPKMRTHISPLRISRTSPKNLAKEHPRQSSLDGKPEFFVPPPPVISPLSPNTEESLLSDDDRPQNQVYSNDPEASKCLGPDSQYEPVREEKEILKTNHHHCYSDTNTMDSGWQSGSEKQVTD